MKKQNQKEYMFNEKQRKEALDYLKKLEYQKALRVINYYIEEHPLDELGISIKASILRKLGRYEEALEYLDTCEWKKEDKTCVRERLYIYLSMERYNEALEILDQLMYEYIFTKSIDEELKKIKLSIDKILLNEEEFNNTYKKEDFSNYLEQQIIEYKEKDMITITKIRNGKKNCNWKFNDNFNIEYEYYSNIKPKINVNNRIPSIAFDEYYIYCQNCGTYYDRNCNYVKVQTIKNTTDIVKFVPIPDECVIKKENDFNELETGNYKKKDMIKKFNDRMNKSRR